MPALTLTAARAYNPVPRSRSGFFRGFVTFCACFQWIVFLVSLKVAHQLSAVDHRALVALQPVGQPLRTQALRAAVALCMLTLVMVPYASVVAAAGLALGNVLDLPELMVWLVVLAVAAAPGVVVIAASSPVRILDGRSPDT